MNQLPVYNRVLVVLIDIVGIWLGFVVIRRSPSKKLSRIFLGMVISMFAWVTFAYTARLVGPGFPVLSLLFLKIAWVVTPLLSVFLYLFSLFLLQKERKYKSLTAVVAIIGCIAIVVVGATDLIVEGTRFRGSELTIVYGSAMWPFLGSILFFMVSTLYILFREFSGLSRKKKKKLAYVSTGVISFYLANGVFNIFLPLTLKITRFYWIGDYSSVALLALIAYAIVKQELFEIKVVLTTGLVGLISLLLIVHLVSSATPFDYVWRGALLVLFLAFGYLLVRSVLNEIRRREEMEKMAEDLQQAYDELKAVDEAKSEFIAMASHQLRTPLTIVKGLSNMILEGTYGKTPKKIKEPLQDIFDSNERLVGVVNDLLDISKADLGKLELERERVDIVDLVDTVAGELEKRAERKKLNVVWKKPRPIMVNIDPIKIRQVVFNVIDNAIKYTEKGEVTVEMKEKEDLVEVTVRDTGEGMSQQEVKRIFDRFTRGQAGINRWVQGAGLGLYLARRYMELHNGRIWAESAGEGEGSTFHIEIPKEK